MTTAAWTAKALEGEVWNIGQLDQQTVRALDKLVRAGKLIKERALWAGLTLKTVWRAA